MGGRGRGLGRTAVESANSLVFGECIIYTQGGLKAFPNTVTVRPQSFSQHCHSEASKLFPKHNYITKGNRKYSSEINGIEDNMKKGHERKNHRLKSIVQRIYSENIR
jgi:hypothetical protein